MEYPLMIMIIFLALASTSVQCRTIFLLGGQSNMVGQGGLYNSIWDGKIPQECEQDYRILRLNNDSIWEVAREPLHLGIGPVGHLSGIGPGMPFAHTILTSHPEEEVGLVPCAAVSSSITQWARGTDLYELMLARAGTAISNGGGEVGALLWYQGESDSYHLVDALPYKDRLVEFFNDFRTDLGCPSLPIIQVGLASGGNYTEIVREAQLNSGVPNVYCVDAEQLNVTFLHLDTESQLKLGKEMGRVFLDITAPTLT